MLYSLKLCLILKPKTKSFDLLKYSGDNFHLIKANISPDIVNSNRKLPENVKFSFSYVSDQKEWLFIVLVSEQFNEENMTYERDFEDYTVSIILKPYNITIDKNNGSFVAQLKNINNTLELIGTFVTHESIAILFFRFDSTIQYCTVDEVNTYLIKNLN